MIGKGTLGDGISARWWVAFCDTDTPYWYKLFVKRGFRHCYAIAEVGQDVFWIETQPHRIALGITINAYPWQIIRDALVLGHTVLYVGKPDAPTQRTWSHSPFLTCASVIAYAMGIDSRALTPYALFRDLKRRFGAELIG